MTLTKSGRDHGVCDAGKGIIRQPELVLAKNGSGGTRLVDTLSGIRSCSVQHPVEFRVTVLCYDDRLFEHFGVGEQAKHREKVAPVTIDVADPGINT